MTQNPVDPVQLAARLIRCPSVTPEEAGALQLLEQHLSEAGFFCTRVDRNGTPNLFARWGTRKAARTFGFNGHTDVVPPGDRAGWSHDPFCGDIHEGKLWGRGAADMKSGVAAFTAAAIDFIRQTPPDGAIILAITGDEEGPGKDGTKAILDWMTTNGESMAVCLVGEPTCLDALGDMMKIGRRGSLTCHVVAKGQQGHVAYPHRAKNPLHALIRFLDGLTAHRLDTGSAHFDPSSLQITTVDTANQASNVIPACCRATLNIRFGDAHTGASLTEWLRAEASVIEVETGVAIELHAELSGESFLTAPGAFTSLIAGAVQAETGLNPLLSTSGGTSDARFIKNHCPVVEFGLVGKTMHQADECVEVAQIDRLKAIYMRALNAYFHETNPSQSGATPS